MNFLQNHEKSDGREVALTGPDTLLSDFLGALTGPNTSPSSLFEERELLTFSVLVIFSLGIEMSFLCSALIRRSFKTIALNERTFSKFVVETFLFSSPSFIAPVAMSSLNSCWSFSSSSFVHEVSFSSFALVSVVFRESCFVSALRPKSVSDTFHGRGSSLLAFVSCVVPGQLNVPARRVCVRAFQ